MNESDVISKLAVIESRLDTLLDHETRIRALESGQREQKYVVDTVKKYSWLIASTVVVLVISAGWDRFSGG